MSLNDANLIEAIHNSKINFALFEHFPSPILLVTDTGQIAYGNQEAFHFLDLPPEELANRSWAGIDAKLTLFAWKNSWKMLIKEQRISYDTDLSSDGVTFRPVRITAVLLAADLSAIFIHDKTNNLQREAQIKLLTSHTGVSSWSYNHLDKSWSCAPGIITDLGLDEKDYQESYTSHEVERILGDTLQETSHQQLLQAFKKALTEGGSFELELLLKSNTENKRMMISGSAIGNGFHTIIVNGILSSGITQEAVGKEAVLAKFSIDHANDLIFWARPDGHIAFANQSVGTKLQYTADELKNMSIKQIAPYFDDDVRTAFWKRLREEQQFEGEFELTARDGSVITILASVNYFKVEEQELACSFCRDITAGKKRRFRRLLSEFTLDTSKDMILWINPAGEIKYFNERFLNKTGYQPEEIVNVQSSIFFPFAEPKRREKLWQHLRTEDYHEMEVSLKIADGSFLPVKAFFNYINYQGEEFNCAYFRDFTQRKERDLVLKLSTEAIQSAAEIVVWLEENGNVIFLNQAMLQYIGGQAKDWKNKPLRKVFPQLQLADLEPGSTIEYSMPSVDGATVYLELTISEVFEGTNSYLMIIGRNFTERYLRRRQIQEAQQQIEKLSNRLQEENLLLREEVNEGYSINNIITVSPKYQKVLYQVSQVADTDTTVLILGETGTGKELLARAVHSLSEREDSPLIKVNCAALPENLIESELFGHEKGAFTGAHEQKKGRFELANSGTIFLDEIGELPLALQTKLLRVLQEGEFERVGGTETISVDIRLIAATNRSLEKMVRKRKFRSDLYYRLNVFPIVNIPLRERPEDIEVLTQHFIKRFAKQQGKKIDKINAGDLKKLQKYRFPGNVRELENIIERSVVLCQGTVLNIQLDPDHSPQLNDQVFLTFEEMQRKYIVEALKKTNGRITGSEGAGRLLGLNDRTLMSKIRKLDIQKKEYFI